VEEKMKILLATDGSEYSETAATFLTLFNFSPEDIITLFHVVSEIPYEDEYSKQILHAIKRVSPKILRCCEDELRSLPVRIRKEAGEGVPEIEIAKKADETDVDLIVMGARGVKGISSLFLGSVTRAVSALSSRPILVTKMNNKVAGEGMKVLFCADGSSPARKTADILAQLPFPEKTELTILAMAWSAFGDIPDRFALEVNEAMKDSLTRIRTMEARAAEKIIDSLQTQLSGRFPVIHPVVKGGDPAQEIIKHAEEMQADLIAIGSRGLKGMKGMLGSVSRRVLGRAHCSVLIGRD
jgi:nucleotide-binding universal stress UspA family protein